MHVVFNGIQALFLLLQPLIEKYLSEQKPVAALVVQSLYRLLP